MLQLNFLRENTDTAIAALQKKQFKHAEQAVQQVLALDEQRRQVQKQRDEAQAQANTLNKQIGQLMKAGQRDEANVIKAKSADLKQQTKQLALDVEQAENKLTQLLYQLPNLPHASVPEGRTADDNQLVKQYGKQMERDESFKPHWELIEEYKLIDFELGNKVTGAGFPFFTGQGARLQRSLVNFFLDEARKEGYTEIQPPVIVNEASGYGTGQLPDKEGQMYKLENHDYYLIPTAEVPITNMLRDVLLTEKELPLRFAGFTPCFRREAGSWGADVRGLNRLHQFDKVEVVEVHAPGKSYEAHEQMTAYVLRLLEALELPYRQLLLCGGDMSFTAAKCYDMEVWSGGQQRWLEVSSVSNFEAYQANRMKMRYRSNSGETQLLHTLNGSAIALPRIMAALLENNQTAEGIKLPKVLHNYFGGDRISK